MAKPTLVGLAYSPWTQRARWALDHHAIAYDFKHYLPTVGEPMLRLKTGNFFGRISVPVLITPHGVVTDSLSIARHADSVGRGSKLVDGQDEAVVKWIADAEVALDAARGLVIRAISASPRAQEESVPLPLPLALKRPLARFGAATLARKWKAQLSESEAEGRMATVLEKLRTALGGKSDGYITGTFSFSDVAMAGVVQAILPVADRWVHLKPATREAWTRPALAARFADLVSWRDFLYEKHRTSKAA